MSVRPLKKIYFDTNSVYRWPNPSRQILQVFNLTNWLKTELYLPTVVEDELEAQFSRSVATLLASISANIRELKTTCWQTITVGIDEPHVDDESLRKDFRRRSDELKTHFGIASLSLPNLDVRALVAMAIDRNAPFEERVAGKDRVVTGLQDAAILFSILADLKDAPKDERYAFVSADGVFQKAETRDLIKSYGVEIEVFKSVEALFKDLWDHVWGEVKAGLDKESSQIGELMERTKDKIAEQLTASLKPSDINAGLFNRVTVIRSVGIEQFGPVYPDIPASENIPPQATYRRPEGSEVKITTTARVDVEAEIETQTYPFWGSLFSDDEPQEPPLPPPPPKTSNKKVVARLTLTLTGTAHNNLIEDLKVVEVAVERY